ncbi:hypothetical protein Sdia_48240 [Streptomyces diastaticus subsp. diastaticus]|uniref:Uncharacterized protein n=1 Tax=Streptomyces diastaticus subsp. diastaticus TaxID=68040 RepID=A0ABQ1CUQ3_STRDI|nr:hypothetical protein [Streptomyces diastaticus]GFH74056.1 hypothetical protein Sdia_48240 [Streptomyces diastaticus subsp. diastaticus]GGU49385.1 hypothetical protein GCM10015534_59080 [Streptomyces diastaticus subsp. diastaticus]
MPQLHRFDNGSKIGNVSHEQLKFLNDHLMDDTATEFCVNSNTLKCLAEFGADPMLIGMLEDALGHDSWMEFTWTTDGPPTPWIQVVPAKPGRRTRRA